MIKINFLYKICCTEPSFLGLDSDDVVSVYQVVEGIKPTLLELQKFETAPEDVELEGNG